MIETAPRTFARYMDEALYGSEGYYATGRAQSGRSGDYFTAPDVGAVFGSCLAAIFSRWQGAIGPSPLALIECGAGEGQLAESVQAVLAPGTFQYTAVERSPARQQALRARDISFQVTGDLQAFQQQPVSGIIFANELVDALAVHRVRQQNGSLQEAYMSEPDDPPELRWGAPSTPELAAYLRRLRITLPDDYETEINLAMRHWIREVALALQKGVVVIIDYGRPAAELFAPERDRGTLRAFRGHQVSADVFSQPGRRDLTSDVDFTSLALDARDAGLTPLAFMDLGRFLLLGAEARNWSPQEQYGLRYLIHPEGLGSAFQVLILGKGLKAREWYFEHNRLRRLGL